MDALHVARQTQHDLAAQRRAHAQGPDRGHLLGAAAQADGLPRNRLGAARRGHLGGARPAAALRALEGDGLGRRRPRGARRHRARAARAGREVAGAARRRSATTSSTNGYDAERGTFTQYYGSQELDAALLNIPLVGFLPGSDPRVQGTVARHRAGADVRRLRAALHDHRGRRRPASGRGRFPRLHLLAGRQLRGRRAGSTRPSSSSSGCSTCATTSACWPRSRTRSPSG